MARRYYSSFYFHYIWDNKGKDEHFWSNTLDAPARKTWAGNMFEQVCKDHIKQIKQKIGILGIISEESIWYIKADKKLHTSGAQVDLIIDRLPLENIYITVLLGLMYGFCFYLS